MKRLNQEASVLYLLKLSMDNLKQTAAVLYFAYIYIRHIKTYYLSQKYITDKHNNLA